MRMLWKPLWRHSTIPWKTELCVYNTSVTCVLVRRQEMVFVWHPHPQNRWQIPKNTAKHQMVLPRLKQNITLRERTEQIMASRLAAQWRLRSYGHLLRRSADHPTHAILRFEVHLAGSVLGEDAAPAGWLDIFTLGITREDTLHIAQNRSQWRA